MAKIKKAQFGYSKSKADSDKAYTRSSFKTADSLRTAMPKSGTMAGRMLESKKNKQKADSIEKAVEKRVGVPRKKNLYEQKNGGKTVKRAKYGIKAKKKK